MNYEKIIEKLQHKFVYPVFKWEDSFGDLKIEIDAALYFPTVQFLKDECGFDMLEDLTAVDYPKREKRFELVCILFSNTQNLRVILKHSLALHQVTASLIPLYPAANWPERECWDFFGIPFSGHPELTRIMNVEDFEGHPLRKDFPLRGKRDPMYSLGNFL